MGLFGGACVMKSFDGIEDIDGIFDLGIGAYSTSGSS
jgi:hypothetical protein